MLRDQLEGITAEAVARRGGLGGLNHACYQAASGDGLLALDLALRVLTALDRVGRGGTGAVENASPSLTPRLAFDAIHPAADESRSRVLR